MINIEISMKHIGKEKLKSLLVSDEVAGRIIRDTAELEANLDLMLTGYFSSHERFFEFEDIILSRLSFQQKIDILRKMSFRTKMKSQPNAVNSLEKFRKIRNILAHNAYISDEKLNSLQSDNEIMRILSNYPKSYLLEFRANKNRINRLIHSHISRKKI